MGMARVFATPPLGAMDSGLIAFAMPRNDGVESSWAASHGGFAEATTCGYRAFARVVPDRSDRPNRPSLDLVDR